MRGGQYSDLQQMDKTSATQLTEKTDDRVHGDHCAREHPVLRLHLRIKGLAKGQLSSYVSSQTLKSWRHVHCLALGFQKQLQEDLDVFIHGRLEGAQRAVRKHLTVRLPFLPVTVPVQCPEDIYLRVELGLVVNMCFVHTRIQVDICKVF